VASFFPKFFQTLMPPPPGEGGADGQNIYPCLYE